MFAIDAFTLKIMKNSSALNKVGLVAGLLVIVADLGLLLARSPEHVVGYLKHLFPGISVLGLAPLSLSIMSGVGILILGWLAGAFAALYITFFRANIFAY